MEIIDNRGLLFDAPHPKAILTAIPRSQQVGDKVLVHWGVEEVAKLRKLNIDAPAPIHTQYEWTGRYKPFDHQRATAAFLSQHRRAFCFNEQGCVDSETEYLSPTGWVKISDYAGGDVAQYAPSTGLVEFVAPDEYVKLPCAEMIRIKTKYGVDQLLSPEHRVLLEDGKRGRAKQETTSAETLLARHDAYHAGHRHAVGGTRGGTDSIAFSAAAIPAAFQYAPDSAMPYTDAELRVLVAAIADGHFGGKTKHCSVRLKKPRKKDRLRNLLARAGISFTERSCLPEGFTRFTFTAPERWKEFGPEFWAASAAQLRVITDEVLHWDGCTTRGARFSTASSASADFIQFAFAAQRDQPGGGVARLSVRARKGRPERVVQIRQNTGRLFIRGSARTMWREPSTDGFKYCFRVPSTYLLFRRNGCVFLSGNTGKTGSAIWAADFLMRKKLVRRVLIICPVSIMDSAWRADLFSFAMHRSVSIAHGTAAKRRQILAEGAEFVIINFDGVKVVEKEIADGGFDLVIVDEANSYKNVQTSRWKTLNRLVKDDTWLWMMTGTPAAQGPMDAHGLAALVNPEAVPRSMTRFRDQVMWQKSRFKWAPRDNAAETVHRVLQPAIRFTKDECLDLPDMVYTTRAAPMTKQQERYYAKLKKDAVLELGGPDDVTAVNAAVCMGKLLQIAAGAVYTDERETVEFDVSSRYQALREAIDESSHKILVFVPYRSVLEILQEKLTADGFSVGVISGGVSVPRRNELFQAFQKTPDPRILLIQPQAAAHGVTLTAADTVVWWSPTASLETFAQANARVHRAGQTKKCTVVQLHGAPVEQHLYKMLRDRIDINARVVDLYKELLA